METKIQRTNELFGQQNLKHPLSNYDLADALKLANNIRSLNLEMPVSSLTQARQVVQDAMDRCGFTWITGYNALDVLDASIDGLDLTKKNRLL